MSNGRIFWNETPQNPAENLALCFFSSKGNKPGKIILNGFFVLDCCQAEWRAKWCSPYIHVPVEVNARWVNALKKGSTQSPGEGQPWHPAPAGPPCLLPASTGRHRGALGALASVLWLASHGDNTGPNTELQPASHPATRCPQEMIVSVPVCTDLFTALEQMQPLSCPAHRLCPSWPCLLNDMFFYPTMEVKPFLTLWQHGLDLGGFLGCKRWSRGS